MSTCTYNITQKRSFPCGNDQQTNLPYTYICTKTFYLWEHVKQFALYALAYIVYICIEYDNMYMYIVGSRYAWVRVLDLNVHNARVCVNPCRR